MNGEQMECGDPICNELASVLPDVKRLMEDMYNGHDDGVKTQVTILVTKGNEREKAENKHYQNIMLFLTILSLFVGALTVLASLRSIKNGEISAPSIFSGPPQVDSAYEYRAPIDSLFNPTRQGEQ